MKFTIQADPKNFKPYLQLAEKYHLGLDLPHFSFPYFHPRGFEKQITSLRKNLKKFAYPLSLHGFFHELYPFSPDEKIRAVCEERVLLNLKIAKKMGIKTIVLHHNFLPHLSTINYHVVILKNNIAFWKKMEKTARRYRITIAIENVWDEDTTLLKKLIESINSPYIKVCLDVGHINLYSKIPIVKWIDEFKKHTVIYHLHNNNGREDNHFALNKGKINMQSILKAIQNTHKNPLICLEIKKEIKSLQSSIDYLITNKYL